MKRKSSAGLSMLLALLMLCGCTGEPVSDDITSVIATAEGIAPASISGEHFADVIANMPKVSYDDVVDQLTNRAQLSTELEIMENPQACLYTYDDTNDDCSVDVLDFHITNNDYYALFRACVVDSASIWFGAKMKAVSVEDLLQVLCANSSAIYWQFKQATYLEYIFMDATSQNYMTVSFKASAVKEARDIKASMPYLLTYGTVTPDGNVIAMSIDAFDVTYRAGALGDIDALYGFSGSPYLAANPMTCDKDWLLTKIDESTQGEVIIAKETTEEQGDYDGGADVHT